MRALSNLFGKGDGPAAGIAAECRAARPDEIRQALALILGTNGKPAEDEQVSSFLQFASQRGIDLGNLWVLAQSGRPAWAILPVVSPGKTMLLLTPTVRPGGLDVGRLIDAVCERFTGSGVHLAQALLDPADDAARAVYTSHGFCEIAELLYLSAFVAGAPAPVPLPKGFSLQTYAPELHTLFARAILASYNESMDCPALNGVRDVEDIMAGHKASGEFDPRFWFLLSETDTARAVLLLTRVPRSDTAELVYLGLTPESRGRGIGDLMVRYAYWAVRQMGLSSLTLAVDARNVPALKLYYRHGMQRVGSKVALMRDLRLSTGAKKADAGG